MRAEGVCRRDRGRPDASLAQIPRDAVRLDENVERTGENEANQDERGTFVEHPERLAGSSDEEITHTIRNGVPYMIAAARTAQADGVLISTVMSHELLECLADPFIDLGQEW